jgi:YidC/Oxa1 family membrane protein insertase
MDENNRNMLLAVILSGVVVAAWHFFYAGPRLQEENERQKRLAQTKTEQSQPSKAIAPAPQGAAQSAAGGATSGACPAGVDLPRESVIAASQRLAIDTPAVKGSINLTGARIDDLVLARYRQTVDPKSRPARPPPSTSSTAGTVRPASRRPTARPFGSPRPASRCRSAPRSRSASRTARV